MFYYVLFILVLPSSIQSQAFNPDCGIRVSTHNAVPYTTASKATHLRVTGPSPKKMFVNKTTQPRRLLPGSLHQLLSLTWPHWDLVENDQHDWCIQMIEFQRSAQLVPWMVVANHEWSWVLGRAAADFAPEGHPAICCLPEIDVAK